MCVGGCLEAETTEAPAADHPHRLHSLNCLPAVFMVDIHKAPPTPGVETQRLLMVGVFRGAEHVSTC